MKPIIGTLLAVIIVAFPMGTGVAFAAEQDTYTETSIDEEYVDASEDMVEVSQEIDTQEPVQEETINSDVVSDAESENNYSNVCEGTISENQKVIIRGVPVENQEEMISVMDQYLPAIMETGKPIDVSNPGFIDAEKYNLNEKGYDSNHCWAATASNILWTTGYARQATNPLTGEAFKSEDEVLTYFSENFTDDVESPDEAVEWFFTGTFNDNNVKDVAHTKTDDSTGLLPDVKHDTYMVSLLNDAREIQKTYDLDSHGVGALIRWIKKDENGKTVLSKNAHWVTANGIVIDNNASSVFDKIKAIVIADSDNDPVDGNLAASAEEKTEAKSGQNNTYTVYKLNFIEKYGVWGIENFYNKVGVITYLYGLKDSDKVLTQNGTIERGQAGGTTVSAVPDQVMEYVNKLNSGEIKVDSSSKEMYLLVEEADDAKIQNTISENEAEKMVINAFTEKDLMKRENMEMLYNYMMKNNMSVFVMNHGKVDGKKDCSVYVNAKETMIYNVSIDGEQVPFKSYKTMTTETNISKIVIDKDYMETLAKGTHTIRIGVEVWENPVDFMVEVM